MAGSSRRATVVAIAIILISALVKTYRIDAPIADLHSWNQCSCAQVIRNFYENGMRFFYPEWDLLQKGKLPPRFEAEEVPLYSFFVAILWKIFAPSLWLARLATILGASIGTLFIFRLTRRLYGESLALFATFFFAFAPMNLFFQRAIMTDAWGIAASIAAIDYFQLYFSESKPNRLAVATTLTMITGMLKIYFLFIGLPIAYLAWKRYGWGFLARLELWAAAIVVLVPNAFWLLHASKIGTLGSAAEGGRFWETQKLWGDVSLLWSFKFYGKILDRLFIYVGTFFLSIFFIYGLASAHKSLGLPIWWVLGFLFYVLIMRDGNQEHSYYQLPYLAPASIIAGVGAAKLKEALQKKLNFKKVNAIFALLLLGFLVNSGYKAYHHFRLDLSSIAAAELVKKYSKPDDLIIVVEPGATKRNQVIFASHRKGWHFWTPKPEDIEEQIKLGAKILVVVISPREVPKREDFLDWLDKNFELLEKQERDWGEKPDVHAIIIYDLTKRKI